MRVVFRLHAARVLFDDLHGNVQPQPRMLLRSLGDIRSSSRLGQVCRGIWVNAPAAAEISLKNMGQILLRNPMSRVTDCEDQLSFRNVVVIIFRDAVQHVFIGPGAAGHVDFIAHRRVADGVVDQIRDHLLNPVLIHNDNGIRRDIGSDHRFVAGLENVKIALIQQFREHLQGAVLIELILHALRGKVGDLRQIVHQSSEHHGLGADHLQIGVCGLHWHDFVQQTFRIALDQSDRGFNFMRNVFQEFFLRLLRGFQIFLHVFLLRDIPKDALDGGHGSGVVSDREIMDLRPLDDNAVPIKTQNPPSCLRDGAGKDPYDAFMLFQGVHAVEKAIRHLIQLFVRYPDQLRYSRAHILEALGLVIVKEHGIRRIFHQKTESGGTLAVQKTRFLEINNGQNQDQRIDGEQTDKISGDCQ